MDSTEHTRMSLEVIQSQLPEDPYDVDRPQHQKILLVLNGFYQTYKGMDVSPTVTLPVLLSKAVFKESATMRSLMHNVQTKLRVFREWYQDPVAGFSFDNVQVRIPYPHARSSSCNYSKSLSLHLPWKESRGFCSALSSQAPC